MWHRIIFSIVYRKFIVYMCFWRLCLQYFFWLDQKLINLKNDHAFSSGMVPCSRFIWITYSSDHRRVWTANLLHIKYLPNPLGHKTLWPSRLGKYLICEIFAVQTLLWSLEFVIQINLEHDTIAVWNLARSWSILTFNSQNICSLFTS